MTATKYDINSIEKKATGKKSEDFVEMAAKIGQFYVEKNNGSEEEAQKQLHRLQISDLQVEVVKTVTIKAGRVGLLVGKRGTNIEELEKFLQCKVKIVEDNDPLMDYVFRGFPSAVKQEQLDYDYQFNDCPEDDQPHYMNDN